MRDKFAAAAFKQCLYRFSYLYYLLILLPSIIDVYDKEIPFSIPGRKNLESELFLDGTGLSVLGPKAFKVVVNPVIMVHGIT